MKVRKYAKKKEKKKEKWKRILTAVQVSDLWREREKSKENMSDIGILSNEVGSGKQEVHLLKYFLTLQEETYLNIPAKLLTTISSKKM